jgi:hypothetical protein
MSLETEDLLRDLSQNAESVCRHYLPAGRREGSYWMVGDLQNNPGPIAVCPADRPHLGAGRSGQMDRFSHGRNTVISSTSFANGRASPAFPIFWPRPARILAVRSRFSRMPVQRSDQVPQAARPEAARLFAASVPLAGSLAEAYLRSRGITQTVPSSTLRFHPKCWHRDEGQTKPIPRPALIAAVTDGAGALQGVHRTWLAPDGQDKAAVDTPRRAMGHLLGNAVRIAPADQTLVLGEGIETMLSVREAAPSLPVWAALSSGHLGAVLLPAGLQRLYIAIDRDPAGQRAAERLSARATEAGIAVRVLEPRLGDFNDDLRAHGAEALRQHLAQQIDPKDQHRLTI